MAQYENEKMRNLNTKKGSRKKVILVNVNEDIDK